jgi:hypothetical protein
MESIANTTDEAGLADLMRRATSLWAALADTESASLPEALHTLMHAAAPVSHIPTLAQLAIRAGQLWQDADGPADDRAAAAGALPEHAALPVLSYAMATARQAGVKVAVVGGRGAHMWAYGENGSQGAFFFPEGNGVEIQWFIDGRYNETCLRSRKVQTVRAARNERLVEIRKAFLAAGWTVWDRASSNTHTLRLLSMIAFPPRPAQ